MVEKINVKNEVDVAKVYIQIEPNDEKIAQVYHDYLDYHIRKLAAIMGREVERFV